MTRKIILSLLEDAIQEIQDLTSELIEETRLVNPSVTNWSVGTPNSQLIELFAFQRLTEVSKHLLRAPEIQRIKEEEQ